MLHSDYARIAEAVYLLGCSVVDNAVCCESAKYKQGKSLTDVELAYDAADMVIGGREEWLEAMTEYLKEIIE